MIAPLPEVILPKAALDKALACIAAAKLALDVGRPTARAFLDDAAAALQPHTTPNNDTPERFAPEMVRPEAEGEQR